MQFPDVVEEQLCSSFHGNGSVCGDEMSPFREGVHDYHDCVVSCGGWKFYNEVHTNGIPPCFWDWQGVEFSCGEVSLWLRPEAHITGRDILANVFGHLWPPEIPRNQLQCLPLSGMSSNRRIRVKGHNLPAEVRPQRNIYFPSEED